VTTPDDLTPEAAEPVTPASILAVPASSRTDLRGRRVLVGLPGVGWRGDLRGDSVVTQASRTYVPVLTEHEWYRAEAERTEVFAPLVPIERVWAEVVDTSGQTNTGRHDVLSRLVSLDNPPRRDPVPVSELALVSGRRVVQAEGAVALRDLRAVTEPYLNTDGDICVRVCTELDWYRWAWSGRTPRTREVPIYLVWVE
jgi:hypothetical protein